MHKTKLALIAVMIPQIASAQVADPKWQPNETEDRNIGIVARSGITPNGNHYRYVANGTGYVLIGDGGAGGKGWTMKCEIDAMTDATECSLTHGATPLFLYLGSGTTVRGICVMRHDYPARRAAIRVDSNTAVSTNTDGCINSPALLKQLMAGTKVAVRWVKWPYDYNEDAVSEIGPLKEALDLTLYIRRNMGKF